jgi:hypothetical protein
MKGIRSLLRRITCAAAVSIAALFAPPALTATAATATTDHGLAASATPQRWSWEPGKYTPINDPAAAPYSTAPVQNNDLGVVGGYYSDATIPNQYHGFIEQNGRYTTIDDPLAGKKGSNTCSVGTSVFGVNDLGWIVGFYARENCDNEGFIDIGGHFTTIRDPSAYDMPGYGTVAGTVNNRGEITGTYYDGAGAEHGFSDIGGHFTTIDCPGAGIGSSYGTAIVSVNDLGVIAGVCFEQNGAAYDFSYSNGTFTPLPNVPGSTSTYVTFLNDFGLSFGSYQAPSTDNQVYGYAYWHGTFTTVPPPPGATDLFFEGCNNLGDVVGLYRDARGNLHAFELTPSSK